MSRSIICVPLLAESLSDAQLAVVVDQLVPRLAAGFQAVGDGVFLTISGELAETITAMIDFELRALQRLRAQALSVTPTATANQ